MGIRTTLNGLEARKEAVKRNTDLSETGKRKQLETIGKDVDAFRGMAFSDLSLAWRGVREKFASHAKRKAEADVREAERWDYNRLAYVARNVETVVSKAASLDDIERAYREVLKSGDTHTRRAWGERVLGEVEKRFKTHTPQHTNIKKLADRDLSDLLDTPDLVALREEGARLAKTAHELYQETKAAQDYYYPSRFLGTGGDEFGKLIQDVDIKTRVDPETLATYTDVQLGGE